MAPVRQISAPLPRSRTERDMTAVVTTNARLFWARVIARLQSARLRVVSR